MGNELQKVLDRMGVTAKAREIPGVPAQAVLAGSRCWRVVLARPVKGEEKPVRLSVAFLAPPGVGDEPKASDVVECLLSDVAAGELTAWDFASQQNRSLTPDVERIHKACKRVGPRVRKFFGDAYDKVADAKAKAA